MSEQVLEKYAAERAARKPRSFVFEGEQFTTRASVPAEVLAAFLDRDELSSSRAVIAVCDETARACLDDPGYEAWQRIRSADHTPALDYISTIWLADQIVTRASGLPTALPAASSDGPQAATATTSTDGSPSTAAIPTG